MAEMREGAAVVLEEKNPSSGFAQTLLEIPKWKLALLGAIPVAAIGFWYYRRSANRKLKGGDNRGKKGDISTSSKSPQTPLEIASAAKNRGNKFFKAGRYEQAIDCYTEAIAKCPEKHAQEMSTFYQNRAAAQDQLKNYTAVIDDCSKALEYNSKYTKAMFRRAKACEIMEDYMQCLEDVTALCILENFGNYQSLTMADRVLKALGKRKAKEAYKSRVAVNPSDQYVRTYFSAFSNDPIMKEIKALTDDNEKHQDESSEKDQNQEQDIKKSGPFNEALVEMSKRSYDDIIRLCSEEVALSDSSHLPQALLLRGTFYQLRGENNKAMEDFDKLLSTEDVDDTITSNARIKRGSLRMQSEMREEAFQDFDQAIKDCPNNSDVYHHRGQLNLLIEKIDDAVNDFQKSVELSPDFSISCVQKCYTEYRHAMQLQSPTKLKESMESFEAALKRFPECAEGLALYAQSLSDQQKFEEADGLFKKALELEPDNGNLYVHRGLLKLQWKSDIEGAISTINKALEFDSKCEFAYETLGTIEVQRGNLTRAVELFNKAIQLARTEVELSHLYSLQDAAVAQAAVARKFGITVPAPGMGVA